MNVKKTVSLLPERTKEGAVSFGCVWDKGLVKKESAFFLTGSADQKEYPVQSEVTAYWPDGSVKWTLHSGNASFLPEKLNVYAGEGCRQIEAGIVTEKQEGGILVDAGRIRFFVPDEGEILFRDLSLDGRLICTEAKSLLILGKQTGEEDLSSLCKTQYSGRVCSVSWERRGPLLCVLCLRGLHFSGEERRFPFEVYLSFAYNDPCLHLRAVYEADGDDRLLCGAGISFLSPLTGAKYNRHVSFLCDGHRFHEACNLVRTWRPRVPDGLYARQAAGELLFPQNEEQKEFLDKTRGALPDWSRYTLCQDAPEHCALFKHTPYADVRSLTCLHGKKAGGVLCAGGEEGGVMLALRDMAKRFPASLRVTGLEGNGTRTEAFLCSPSAAPVDLRHYTRDAYDQSYYEGFPDEGAEAAGICFTGEMLLKGFSGPVPEEKEMLSFANRMDHPPVYCQPPKEYHQARAFGFWGLKAPDTEAGRWLEEQLDKAFRFYENEVTSRGWLGLFDHGDFMHTYDRERHQWCYDMGGYAWQNTELMPTLWLWFSFLRSGREDVFSFAESMTRHCSESDIYHSGPFLGLGTRHNVSHWGCPCKELRVAQAENFRMLYYLTGDARIGSILHSVREAEQAVGNLDPLRYFYDKSSMTAPTHVRSGPDWSALCSDWMCEWERTGDDKWSRKLFTGMQDLKNAPLGLISGTAFEFEPETGHLIYLGEEQTGSFHLQLCQGASQIWTELADWFPEDEKWRDMLCDLGEFCLADAAGRQRLGRGLTGTRYFAYPYFAAGVAAYAAACRKNADLARRVWAVLLYALTDGEDLSGFTPVPAPDGKPEIPWISTNFVSQWCLNVILALDFAASFLPANKEEIRALVRGLPPEMHHNA